MVGVDVTNRGSDMGEVASMLAQIGRRTGMHPADSLVDGGFADHASIDAVAASGGRLINVLAYNLRRATVLHDAMTT